MYRLEKSEARWLEILPGVRVLFRPISLRMVRAAYRAVRSADGEADAEQGVAADEVKGEAFDRAMIVAGIVDWTGIGGADGEALAVTPETLAMFVDDPVLLNAASLAYVTPFMVRGLEKNG